MKFYSFPGSSQFPYAAKISQRIPRIPFKNIAKGYYVKKTNKHQMWKERAPRRYTILWFWSQYFDCVDINLASFAQVLHPLHPHPPPPTPSQGFVNTTSANIRMVGGSPPNDSNAQWTSCMAYSQKRLKKKKRKENEKKKNYLSKTSDWGHNLVLYNYEQTMSWIQFLPHVIKFCAFNWTTCLLKIYESFCSF